MANFPSDPTTYVFCSQATLNDGTDNYVCLKNLSMQWSFEMIQETVIGSVNPVIGTGAFRGTIEFEILGNTQSVMHNWLNRTNGQLSTKTFTIGEVDFQASPDTRTWTVYAKINDYRETFRDDRFIMYHVSGVLTQQPSCTVA